MSPRPGSWLALPGAACRPRQHPKPTPSAAGRRHPLPPNSPLGPQPRASSQPSLCPGTSLALTYAVWPVWRLKKKKKRGLYQMPVLKQSGDTKRVQNYCQLSFLPTELHTVKLHGSFKHHEEVIYGRRCRWGKENSIPWKSWLLMQFLRVRDISGRCLSSWQISV